MSLSWADHVIYSLVADESKPTVKPTLDSVLRSSRG